MAFRGSGSWHELARRVATVVALAGVACSCQTDPPPTVAAPAAATRALVLNTSPEPIEILYGLDQNDVEFAILLAVMNPARPPTLASGRRIDDSVLADIRAGMTDQRLSANPWSYANREAGMVYVDYRRDGVDMRVGIRFDERHIMMRIIESENLGQTEDRIYADALVRLQDLERRIRERVVAVAQRNWYDQPVPASPE